MIERFMAWITDIINDESLAAAITAFITVLVFVQSVLILLFKALATFVKRKRNRVLILPKEHIVFNFATDGLGLQFFFTLISKNIDTIVTDMRISLKRDRKVIYSLKWDTFHSTYVDRISAAGHAIQRGVNFEANRETLSYSHPVYLKQKVTQLFYVGFKDIDANKELQITAGDYDLIFEIYSTEKKEPFKSKKYTTISEANITTLMGQRGKKLSANPGTNELVRVEIFDYPSKRGLCKMLITDWIKRVKRAKNA